MPSIDLIWTWAAAFLVGAVTSWFSQKITLIRLGAQLKGHLSDCVEYRKQQLEAIKALEIRQSERHRENQARLGAIEHLLIAKALGVRE